MAKATELSSTQVVTADGVVTATVVDALSPDRMALVLFRGSAAALYGRVTDATELVVRDVKDLVVFPFSEL